MGFRSIKLAEELFLAAYMRTDGVRLNSLHGEKETSNNDKFSTSFPV
jgi:hypothetical protein